MADFILANGYQNAKFNSLQNFPLYRMDNERNGMRTLCSRPVVKYNCKCKKMTRREFSIYLIDIHALMFAHTSKRDGIMAIKN